jgi:DNA-binding IclR family transcriptional regulator
MGMAAACVAGPGAAKPIGAVFDNVEHGRYAGAMRGQVRIQSLARADAILEVLASGPRAGRRLRDIACATELAASTAATLLKSLVALELAEKIASSGHYRLGKRLLRLGRIAEKQLDLLALGRPGIVRLCQSTRETVNLLVPSATAMVVAESLQGDIVLKTSALKGAGLPLRGTASGKCFQAFGSAAPGADLAAIRRLGYATEEDEFQPGVIAVAAPILDGQGRILGTLSIHGPSHRFTVRRAARLGSLLKQEARRITASLP